MMGGKMKTFHGETARKAYYDKRGSTNNTAMETEHERM